MKILFYDTKKYDKESFDMVAPEFTDMEIDYLETDLNKHTARLAAGYDAICVASSSYL